MAQLMRNKSCMPGMGRRATTEPNRREPGKTILDPSLSRWAVKLGKGPNIYIYTSNSLGKSPLRDTGPEQWKHFGKIPPSQESDGWLWIPGFHHAWCALRNQGKYPVRASLWVLSS